MTAWSGLWFAQNKSQQSTHQSTLFFSTIRRLAANTPFSARFHNNLTFNTLQSFNFIKHASSNTPHHETCLTAMRNMPNRSSIHGKRWLDTWSLAARFGIFRNDDAPKMEFQTHLATFKCAKMHVSLSISSEKHDVLFYQNIQRFLWVRPHTSRHNEGQTLHASPLLHQSTPPKSFHPTFGAIFLRGTKSSFGIWSDVGRT